MRNRWGRKVLGLALAISACGPACANPLDDHSSYTDSLVSGSKWSDGLPVLSRVNSAVTNLSDYCFESKLTVNKDDKIKHDLGKFFYKKSNKMRVECQSGGMNNGAIVVRNAQGRVRGSGGGMLKFMKMNLEDDSRMLLLPNGYNVMKSDFASLLGDLLRRASTSQMQVSDVISDKLWGRGVRVIDVKKGNGITDRLFVGSNDLIPVEWDLYKNGKLVSVTRFENFRSNVGLDDNLFEL